MKLSEKVMGMIATIDILDPCTGQDLDDTLNYFHEAEKLFSTYIKSSEISKINLRQLRAEDATREVRTVLRLCEDTKLLTRGYFDIKIDNVINPSGILGGYMVEKAADILIKRGFKNFYVGLGNDLKIMGHKNASPWKIGIKNPVLTNLSPKVLLLSNMSVATSAPDFTNATIYNPIRKKIPQDAKSATVIAKSATDADRFATAAFAMGVELGFDFLEDMEGIEGIIYTNDGQERMTAGLSSYF